jgi:peroxiredoxin
METHRDFAAQNGIEFPLVSDLDKSIKKLYGRGRVTYLIDKGGVIRYVQKGVPDNKAFLNQLKKLQ